MKISSLVITGALLGIIVTSLISCGKDELTEPATVTFEFHALSETTMGGLLVIERLELNLSKLDISGRRKNENDMFFSRSLNTQNGKFVLLGPEPPSTILQIPQGSYETLVFYTSLREEDYEFEYGSEEDEDDQEGDLAAYLNQAKPGVLLVGRYTNADISFPVIVALNDDIRRLALDATQDGLPQVLLQKEVPARATVTFDLAHWFTAITEAMLESAVSFPLDDEYAIVISDEYNEALYNQIAARIEGSATLTIQNQ